MATTFATRLSGIRDSRAQRREQRRARVESLVQLELDQMDGMIARGQVVIDPRTMEARRVGASEPAAIFLRGFAVSDRQSTPDYL